AHWGTPRETKSSSYSSAEKTPAQPFYSTPKAAGLRSGGSISGEIELLRCSVGNALRGVPANSEGHGGRSHSQRSWQPTASERFEVLRLDAPCSAAISRFLYQPIAVGTGESHCPCRVAVAAPGRGTQPRTGHAGEMQDAQTLFPGRAGRRRPWP